VLATAVLLVSLAGCGGVSQTDYQTALDEKAALETQMADLQDKYDTLSQNYNALQANRLVLRRYLSDTYDGYRAVVLQVTMQVYGDSLTKSEWETIFTEAAEAVPTFDEVTAAINVS
jgi:hypothetical protein